MNDNYNRIKVVLAEKGKTNKWLAEQTGKTEMTVSRWTRNKMQPSIEQLFAISKVLDVDSKDLTNSNTDI